MKKTTKRLSFIGLVLLGLSVSLFSCNKKDPAKAEITVVDSDNNRIEDATVEIFCTAIEKQTCEIDTFATTNSAGQVEIEFNHPAIYGSDDIGFAVLKTVAYKNFDTTLCHTEITSQGNDTIVCKDTIYTKSGDMFIELQIDKVTKESITIVYED